MAVTQLSLGRGFGADWAGDLQAFSGVRDARADPLSQPRLCLQISRLHHCWEIQSPEIAYRLSETPFPLTQSGLMRFEPQAPECLRLGQEPANPVSSLGPASVDLPVKPPHAKWWPPLFLKVVLSKLLLTSSLPPPPGRPPTWKTRDFRGPLVLHLASTGT